MLNNVQKDLILRYTEDSYEWVNEDLRRKKGVLANTFTFSQDLEKTIKELPNYDDTTHRGVNLTMLEMKKYEDAYNTDSKIIEHTFISTSQSQRIAKGFMKPKKDKVQVLFEIAGKTGKLIAEYSKSPTEKEVLFAPNTIFWVREIVYPKNGAIIIRLREV